MGKFLKKISLILFIIILLLIGAGGAATYFLGDKITGIILSELNKKIEGEINVQAVDFTLVKKFPNASIEFKNIIALSSKNINKKDFSFNADTFLIAQSLFLEFSIRDLIDEKYTIKNISIENAYIQILFDKRNENNFSFIKKNTDKNKSNNVTIDINALTLRNVKLATVHKPKDIIAHNYIKQFKLKGKINGKSQKISSEGNLIFKLLKQKNKIIISSQEYDFDIDAFHHDKIYDINKCHILNNGHLLDATGNLTLNGDSTTVDINFTSNEWSFNHIKDYLPPRALEKIDQYKIEALFECSGSISGMFYEKQSPQIGASFDIADATVLYKQAAIKILGKGKLHSPKLLSSEDYIISLTDAIAKYNGTTIKGNVSISNFINPVIDSRLSINGTIQDLNEINSFDPENKIKGNISGSVFLNGKLNTKGKYSKSDHKNLKIESAITLNGVSYNSANDNISISKCNGDITFDNNDVYIKSLDLVYNDIAISTKGKLGNAVPYAFFEKEELYPKLQVLAGEFDTKKLMSSQSKETSSENAETKIIHIPNNIKGIISLESKSFIHDKVFTRDLKANISVSYRKIVVDKFSCSTMEGKISGRFILKELVNNNFSINGTCNLHSINVKSLFHSLDNFDQDFITENNLNGMLFSDIIFQTEWTNSFEFLDKAFFTEASTTIKNGQLIDFKPAEKLSKFVELDELNTISFSTLHNDFVIKNETFFIPKMDINSSAFNISLAGSQKFEGDFDYRLQLLLNEFLSRKRKNKQKDKEYFGDIEDDGLGRTKLFLKIISSNGDVKVSYDRSEAKTVLKDRFKDEKKNIVKIFKEEFKRDKDTSEPETKKNNKQEDNFEEQDEFIFEFDE